MVLLRFTFLEGVFVDFNNVFQFFSECKGTRIREKQILSNYFYILFL